MSHTSSRPARLKTVVAAVGAAAVLVAGGSLAADAAGHAKPLLAGKNNKAKKTTTISNKKATPALALKTKGGPALTVNTNSLIANLNADLLDGASIEQVSPTKYVATIGTPNGPGPGSAYFATTQLPTGQYHVTVDGLVSLSGADETTCLVTDYTRLLNSGGTDISSIFISDTSDVPQFHTEGLANVTAGNNFLLACGVPATSKFAQPITFTVEKVERTAAVPGLAPFTPKPGKTLPQPGSLLK